MTISPVIPEATHLQLLSRDVAVRMRRGTVVNQVTTEISGTPYQAAGPYTIYNSTIEALLDRTLLASAEETAWAYLILSGQTARIAEVAMREGQLTLVCVYPGAYAEVFVDALWRAERYDKANPNEDYDMRVLRVPSLSLNAIWLHGHKSRLAPIAPAPGPLREKGIYGEPELVHLLRNTARRRLLANDREI